MRTTSYFVKVVQFQIGVVCIVNMIRGGKMLRFETIEQVEQNGPVLVQPIKVLDVTLKKSKEQVRREEHCYEMRLARGIKYKNELLSTGMSESTARELMYHLYKGKRQVLSKLIHRKKSICETCGISRGNK